MSDTAAYILAAAILIHPLLYGIIQGAAVRMFYYQARKALVDAADEVKRQWL